MSETDKFVDTFVAFINSRPRDLRLKYEVPESVSLPNEDETYAGWQIVRCDGAWLPEIEQSLPAALPPTFRSLVSRYCFPALEVGPIVLHGNTSEGSEYFEFRKRLFQDPYMSPFLLRHGFIQFGKPADWSYDPVCFHLASRSKRECPIVRLDHEEILIRQRVRVTASIAPSLRKLFEQLMAACK